jgi:Icc-related predicted phosphoesterase
MSRFVLISDTHNRRPKLPEGAVLVHAGDLTNSGSRSETEAAMRWLGEQAQKFKHVVFVGGNHDWFLYHLSLAAGGPNAVREFVRPYGENIHYLEDELIGVQVGSEEPVLVYGSPAQPEFYNWAWNYQRGPEIKAVWDKIPTFGVDLLVTHGPPYRILDWVGRDRVGCKDLLDAVERVQPKVHVFGHIHAGHGKAYHIAEGKTVCYNAALVNDKYELDPKHHPWVLEWDGKRFTEIPGTYAL